MATKEKVLVTRKGRFIYPRLHTPDTKFDADGVYGLKLAQSPEEAAGTVKVIEAALDAAVEHWKREKSGAKIKRADAPYTTDEDTGEIIFTFKMKAKGVSKKTGKAWERRPAVYDRYGKPIGPDTRIGGGSIGQVAYVIGQWANYTPKLGAGVTLYLESVMVHEVVEWGGQSAESYGFEVEALPEEPETAGESDGGDF